jgi:L-asparagine transporter-like permease
MLQMHEANLSSASQLRRGLSQRQLNMIALGGVIGAGLFVGSGVPRGISPAGSGFRRRAASSDLTFG